MLFLVLLLDEIPCEWKFVEDNILYKFVYRFLAGKHTIFGRINNGMSVVKRIGLVETDPGDR